MRVAGIGFRGSAGAAAICDALGGAQVDALATLQRKADALRAFDLGWPVIGVSDVEIAAMQTPSHSERVFAQLGTGSLAEAAALVAAGPDARLLVTRRISSDGMATAAIAEGQDL
ncbi:cobalt-precorrin 5A hydrolase [Monaibacterium marinum]|uniref:Cobalt-precorrin 5A hydrolase n=1 Tax=Pontivivens marinum TaxID=1690039 RepID=A0A2C9CSE2_9RHOB|nr:cobalamin biosynthesis protein [Monaibacterium marinum]SOH94264.1 cobalt-precorrin 5A hydrolase [Monaibacterium marinum]